MSPPEEGQGEDEWVWGLENNGKFSIRTAYEIIYDAPNPRSDVDWRLVWQWQGPGRVQYFLWLVAQGKLLTNLERQRRHLTADGSCPRCRNGDESILHVLRDCTVAKQAWDHLGFDETTSIRRGDCTNTWINELLHHEEARDLVIACWYLWKARNAWIFSGDNSTAATIARRIQAWSKTVKSAIDHHDLIAKPTPVRTRVDIAWEPGAEGWVVLNTDGSVRSERSKAAAGGVIRNYDGRFLYAFCANLGNCSIMRAELQGIINGLRIAWDNGFRRVDARTDSQAIFTLIREDRSATHQHAVDIDKLRELLQRDWEVTISHIYREGNSVADYLATLGHDYPWGVHLISVSDCNLNYFLRRDCIGISVPRHIPVN
ncbi:Putative ribonuclease H protein At1g65750 [Linum perenne]